MMQDTHTVTYGAISFGKEFDAVTRKIVKDGGGEAAVLRLEQCTNKLGRALEIMCPQREVVISGMDTSFSTDPMCRTQRTAYVSKGKVVNNTHLSIGYTEGYSRGQLELTPHLPVTSEIAKIIVEFGSVAGILVVFHEGSSDRKKSNAIRVTFSQKTPIVYSVEAVRLRPQYGIETIGLGEVATEVREDIQEVKEQFKQGMSIVEALRQVTQLSQQFRS